MCTGRTTGVFCRPRARPRQLWLVVAGRPGVKRGYERPVEKLGYIHAADVVPTFCQMLGAAPPRQAQGDGGAGFV